MTVVKVYSTLEQARSAQDRLKSAGIAAEVLAPAANDCESPLAGCTEIRLAVAPEDMGRAGPILADAPAQLPPQKPDVLWIASALAVAVATVLYMGIKQQGAGSTRDEERTVAQDRNGDGRPDVQTEYQRNGDARRAFEDDNFDGRWDARYEFKRGFIVRAEQDLDFDGKFDAVTEYEHGLARVQTVRPGGAGNPLFRHEFVNGRLSVTWSDPQRDGAWKERVTYDSLGIETGRQQLQR